MTSLEAAAEIRREYQSRYGEPRLETVELGRVKDYLLALDEPAPIGAGDVVPALFVLTLGRTRRQRIKGPITRQHLVEWCAAENDYYALHYDERVAERMNVPGSPIQGTLKFALLGQLIQGWMGRNGTLRRISANYRGLNLEGEVIIARAQVKNVVGSTVTFDIWVENPMGARSTTGEAVVDLGTR